MLKKFLTVLMSLVFALGILTTSVLRTSAQTSSQNYKIAPVVGESLVKVLADYLEKRLQI